MDYLFGGLGLATYFRFDQLDEADDRIPRARLRIVAGTNAPPPGTVVHRGSGRYRMTAARVEDDWVFRSIFPDVFVFSPARNRIACHVASDDPQAWHDVLLRRVLPRASVVYGATTLHAATIAWRDRCLLLLGRSGVGKSTLTAFCASAGWEVLSDDASILWVDDPVVAAPVQHGVGVWEETRDALALPAADWVPMPGYGGRKGCFRPPGSTPRQARPLSAILTVERRAGLASPGFAPLTRRETLAALIAQDVAFMPGAPPDAASAAAFGRVAALARRVPGYRLTCPDGFAALPDVEALLRCAPIGQKA